MFNKPYKRKLKTFNKILEKYKKRYPEPVSVKASIVKDMVIIRIERLIKKKDGEFLTGWTHKEIPFPIADLDENIKRYRDRNRYDKKEKAKNRKNS